MAFSHVRFEPVVSFATTVWTSLVTWDVRYSRQWKIFRIFYLFD
jgi:hypothetical protein